jgi:hypothetical protein
MLPASMFGDYSTTARLMPSCFLHHTDLLGNLFLIMSLLDLLSLPFLFWNIIPAILPAMMLGYYSMSASLMPSKFFHRHFDLLEACFLYVVTRPLFVRKDFKQVCSKVDLFFFLDRRAWYSTC